MLTLKYNYYNHPIEQSFDTVQAINEMPYYIRLHELFNILTGVSIVNEEINKPEAFLVAILKDKHKELGLILNELEKMVKNEN